MDLISISLFTVLQLIALVHFGWAFGMAWPAKQRAALGAMVVGSPPSTPMPSTALTIAAASAISGLGFTALWGAGYFTLPIIEAFKGWALCLVAAVFLLRGIATYLPFGPLQAAVEPFRTLDRRYFAPLCLLLSAGFVALLIPLAL